uniref:Immunoglobulin subtype domain-containing protein n=1 Tax=Myripristis murdjan TaxID=586833 RepID=A0A668AH31_9TELE
YAQCCITLHLCVCVCVSITCNQNITWIMNTSLSPDNLKLLCLPVNGTVSVPCPNPDGAEVAFSLSLGRDVIASHSCKEHNNASKHSENVVKISAGVELHRNVTEGSISFVVAARKSGNYSCAATRTWPPPILPLHNTSNILVLMEGHDCTCESDHEDQPPPVYPLWIWILGIAAVGAYSLIVTIIAFVNWLKRKDSQSDYMNTKPRAPKGHRKGGVQHPIPRHF